MPLYSQPNFSFGNRKGKTSGTRERFMKRTIRRYIHAAPSPIRGVLQMNIYERSYIWIAERYLNL